MSRGSSLRDALVTVDDQIAILAWMIGVSAQKAGGAGPDSQAADFSASKEANEGCQPTPKNRNMAKSHTRTPLEMTASMSLIPEPVAVLASYGSMQLSPRQQEVTFRVRIGEALHCFSRPGTGSGHELRRATGEQRGQ